MISKKVCMLGAFAVGKTSLVRRFVESIFSDEYQTTIGVKISKRSVTVDETEVLNMIWDIEGADDFVNIKPSHLRGASGVLLVLDGTRHRTITQAREIKSLIEKNLSDVPVLLLINKCDLKSEWKIPDDQAELVNGVDAVYYTSAKTGENVDKAFYDLSTRMMKL